MGRHHDVAFSPTVRAAPTGRLNCPASSTLLPPCASVTPLPLSGTDLGVRPPGTNYRPVRTLGVRLAFRLRDNRLLARVDRGFEVAAFTPRPGRRPGARRFRGRVAGTCSGSLHEGLFFESVERRTSCRRRPARTRFPCVNARSAPGLRGGSSGGGGPPVKASLGATLAERRLRWRSSASSVKTPTTSLRRSPRKALLDTTRGAPSAGVALGTSGMRRLR